MDESDEWVPDPKYEREQLIVEHRKGLGEMSGKTLDDFGFAMNRLHDPCNYDHITIEEMLARYHFRDLAKSKLFRIAKKIFGDKMDPKFRIRTRTFNLTGVKHGQPKFAGTSEPPIYDTTSDYHHEEDDDDDDLVDINDLRLRKQKSAPPETKQPSSTDVPVFKEYLEWFDERKKLRQQLNSLGLSESWLKNKPDKTIVEHEIYNQLINDRQRSLELNDEEESLDEENNLEVIKSDGLPRIRRPSPIAIRRLDRFLRANRLRLIDMFRTIDKNKNWHITRDEFRSAVEEYNMDISPSLLEDLITTLDVNHNGELNYKELVKGLELYQMEKREARKKGLPTVEDEDEEEIEEPIAASSPVDGSPEGSRTASGKPRPTKSAQSSKTSRVSSATTLLEAPELDLQESRLVLKSQEKQVDLRKRDRNFLRYQHMINPMSKASGVISPSLSREQSKLSAFKTGYKPIDDHCKFSTLTGDNASMINDFRQLRLKEYYSILRLCEEKGITLSRNLLDRVLLHPGDKSTKLMLKQGIRQPGSSVPLSKHFADPPKKPRTPIEFRNRGKMIRDQDGQLLIDYKHQFMPKSKTKVVGNKVQLTTGKAVISRKVDCWLTFEEYEKMTRGFYKKRYVRMENTENSAATWPGYMLDKMRIYLDHDKTSEPTNAVFNKVKREPHSYHGYDNNLNNWAVSDAGYLYQGDLRHPKKHYTSNNLVSQSKPDIMYKNHLVHKQTAALTQHTKNTHNVFHE